MDYKLSAAKPSSCEKIVEAFSSFLRNTCDKNVPDDRVARSALEKVVCYKKGYTIRKYGSRPRTSVNALLQLVDGAAVPVTLREGQAPILI